MAKYSNCAYSSADQSTIDATLSANGVRTTLGKNDPYTKADYAIARQAGAPYGPIAAFIVAPLTKGQLTAYTSTKVAQMLNATRTYAAAGGTIKTDATAGTISHLLALQQWGASNPDAINNWIANDGTVQSVTGAQIVAIAPLVGEYAREIYSTEMTNVLSRIEAGSITTIAEIDAYPWTV